MKKGKKAVKNKTANGKKTPQLLRLKKKLKDLEWASKKTNEGIRLLYKDLEKKNARLKEMDKLKSQFVANVAHELKNPLSIIRESMQIAIDSAAGTKLGGASEMLELGRKTIDRLARLVANILDVSKIESGKISMNISEFDLSILVDEAISEFTPELAKKSVNLHRENHAESVILRGDRDKLCEVILNLLGNAVKYTPDGGDITIKVSHENGDARFEILNTGSPIPKASAEKIFDKYERILSERQEGTGLGLTIAKDIVNLHKGRIWVEAKGTRGNLFVFMIPRK